MDGEPACHLGGRPHLLQAHALAQAAAKLLDGRQGFNDALEILAHARRRPGTAFAGRQQAMERPGLAGGVDREHRVAPIAPGEDEAGLGQGRAARLRAVGEPPRRGGALGVGRLAGARAALLLRLGFRAAGTWTPPFGQAAELFGFVAVAVLLELGHDSPVVGNLRQRMPETQLAEPRDDLVRLEGMPKMDGSAVGADAQVGAVPVTGPAGVPRLCVLDLDVGLPEEAMLLLIELPGIGPLIIRQGLGGRDGSVDEKVARP